MLEDRARREVLIAREPALQVLDRDGKRSIARSRRRAQRDQRAAFGDELASGRRARRRRCRRGIRAGCSARRSRRRSRAALWSGRMIASNFCAQLAGADVGVVDRRQVELVLLEHPARPAFVHVAAGPRRVHADARRLDRASALRPGGASAARDLEAELARDRVERLPAARCTATARRATVPLERQLRAVLQQAVDRFAASGPL